MRIKQTETLIIGFGKAGKTLAAKLGALGRSVILVEADPTNYGGSCINVACLPTKHLVEKAAQYKSARALGLKLTEEEWVKRYAQIIQDKKALMSKLRQANFNMLDQLPTVEVITGHAHFRSDKCVQVDTTDEIYEISATNIVINTGSKSRLPEISGLKLGGRIYDSSFYLDEERFLPHLYILGAGFISLEFACMAASFGSQVTILQPSNRLLGREDEDDREALITHLKNLGIELRLSTELMNVQESGDKLNLRLRSGETESEVKADGLLVATGRIPNTAGLGLENTDLAVDTRGNIVVDQRLKTNIEKIWAVGDVKGGPLFTYISLDDARVVLPQILGKASLRNAKERGTVPSTVFLDSPYARVGLNISEAKAAGLDFVCYKMPLSDIPKAKITGHLEGYWKILVDRETRHILGATLFGFASEEVINLLSLAIDARLMAEQLSERVYNHPVLTEGLNLVFAPKYQLA